MSESSLAGGPERSEAERSEAAGPEPTQPNWIQTNLATKRRDQTGGLIESGLALKVPPPHPGYGTGKTKCLLQTYENSTIVILSQNVG